MNRGRRSDT